MADHDFTTTAVTSTATTLVTMRARLRIDLHDDPASRWTDAVLNAHLGRATRELSLVWPREQVNTLSTVAGTRDVSIAALENLVEVQAVEYPVDDFPPVYVQFSRYMTTLTLLIEQEPSAVEDLLVYWGKLHTLETGSSTIPAPAEECVLLGAGAYAALEWASFASNRANVAGPEAVRQYQAWGERRLDLFHAQLAQFGREARVRLSAMFVPADQAGDASQSVVRW